jgi:hypothetical protein
LAGEPAGRDQRRHRPQRPAHLPHPPGDRLGQLAKRRPVPVGGWAAGQSVAQLAWVEMVQAGFGVEDQDALGGVTSPLGGQVGGRQLPLADPPGRIDPGVVGQQHPRGGQTLGDGGSETGEVLHLGVVHEHPQPLVAQRLGKVLDGFAIGPGVADEHVVAHLIAVGCWHAVGDGPSLGQVQLTVDDRVPGSSSVDR